jgi:hypothetical protein
VINSLNHSGKDIFIISLPVLLVLEEERVKKRREGQSSNLLMAQNYAHTSHALAFKGEPKKFKKKWKVKLKDEKKVKGACFKCSKIGHFKVNCPKTNRDKKQREMAMPVTEVIMVELTSNSRWMTQQLLDISQEIENTL